MYPQINIYDLLDDRKEYFNPVALFMYLTGEIPGVKVCIGIDHYAAFDWLINQKTFAIKNQFIKERNRSGSKKWLPYAGNFMLDNKILIHLSWDRADVVYLPDQSNDASSIAELLRRFKKKVKKSNSICLVTPAFDGLQTTEITIKKPRLNLAEQYPSCMERQHQLIVKLLRTKMKSGLHLLHGAPGTGKSTYIRYLIHLLNKKVIFMPPKLAAELDSPGLTELLINNPNSIFVIEDAEELLTNRAVAAQSGISALLNITDGLLGQSLGIQCIATFNTAIHNIDPALLRKGRLISSYEFKALPEDQAKSLLHKIGEPNHEVKGAMTLAEIYNINEQGQQVQKERVAIGFGKVG